MKHPINIELNYMGMAQCLDVKSVDMENYAVNLGLSRITQNGHTSIQKLHYSRSTACLSHTHITHNCITFGLWNAFC